MLEQSVWFCFLFIGGGVAFCVFHLFRGMQINSQIWLFIAKGQDEVYMHRRLILEACKEILKF